MTGHSEESLRVSPARSDLLVPIPAGERIEALDVVRGFALIGILLMNVEFFNRPLVELGLGLPGSLKGMDWWAGWLIYVLVQGKFWTLFSLLFGMGFAIMLRRAEQVGRDFLQPYLRRIAALACFGVAHSILIWGGDILFSYALAASGLLVVLYGKWEQIFAALLIGLACSLLLPAIPMSWWVAALGYLAFVAVWLRIDPATRWLGRPAMSLDLRTVRMGVAMYLVPFVLLTASATFDHFAAASPSTRTVAEVEHREWESAEEARIQSAGSYLDNVQLRADQFLDNLPSEAAFATILVGMFLIGCWFIRSGVMEDVTGHRPFFRRLVRLGLPVGIGMGLLGSVIATARTPGLAGDPYGISEGLMMLGNLPACLGYLGLVVLLLHSNSAWARISGLAPLGRMALTNYLTHSVIGTLFFYGYGLGHYGLGRAWQVVFVAVLIGLQLLFCHWWLARFRFGPMEWLWRAFTYWQLPAMRRQPSHYTIEHGQT